MGIRFSNSCPECGGDLRVMEQDGPPVHTDGGGVTIFVRVQCSSCLKVFRGDTHYRRWTAVEKGGA